MWKRIHENVYTFSESAWENTRIKMRKSWHISTYLWISLETGSNSVKVMIPCPPPPRQPPRVSWPEHATCDKRPCWTTKTTAPGKSCIESNGCSGSPGIASTPKGNAKVWNKHDFELNQFVLIALQRLCSVSHPFAKAKASWSISSTWQNWWRRKCTLPS